MTENYMHSLLVNEKISKIVAPIAIVFMLWLLVSVMFNFKVFMLSLSVGFILIALYAIVDLTVVRPSKS